MISHKTYMKKALQEAEQAFNRGEFPVGCVLIHNDTVVATGARSHSQNEVNELDHAEITALRFLMNKQPGINLGEVTVYSTMEPCLMCFSTLILNGIRKIVYGYEDVMGGGTNLPLQQLSPLYAAMDIEIISSVMRKESLCLFQQFFNNPNNDYWSDSLLASYTLETM